MQGRRCWNCMSDRENVRSPRTGIVYCVACGTALNGPGDAGHPDKRYPEQEREGGNCVRDDDAR